MIRRPPRSTRTDTLFPYTTLFRSVDMRVMARLAGGLEDMSLSAAVRDTSTMIESAPARTVAPRRRPEIRPTSPKIEPCSMGTSTPGATRSEEHTSELQSLMRISYAVFCLKKKNRHNRHNQHS